MRRPTTLLAGLAVAAMAAIASAQGDVGSTPRPADRNRADPLAADVALRQARRLCEFGQYRAAEATLRVLNGEARASDETHVAGAIHLTARIDYESGRYEQALGAARRYERYLAQLRESGPEIIAQRQAIFVLEAQSQLALGKPSEADQCFRQALDLRGGLHESDPLWEARVALVRAGAADARRDRSAADAFWRQVEMLARPVLALAPSTRVRRRQRGEALHLVKESLVRTGRAAEALPLLDAERERLGPQGRGVVAVWRDIADCYERLHDGLKARQALTAALDLVGQDEQGQASPEFADLLDRLGTVYARQREAVQARDCWRRAAAIDEKLCAVPANDDRRRALRAQRLQQLERLYQRLEDWHSGARAAARLLEVREQTLLPDDPMIWRSKTALGEFHARAHDATAARPLLTEALRYWRDRRPAAPLEIAGILNNLATIALQEGAEVEAAAMFEQAAPLYRLLFGPASAEHVELENQLAEVLATQGRTRLAIDHYRQALEACRKAAAAGKPRAADLLPALQLNLIALYRSQRQYGAAAGLCEQALGDYQRDHPGHQQVQLLFYLAAGSLRLAQHESQVTAAAEGADLTAAETLAAKASALCERAGLGDKVLGANADMLAGEIALKRHDLDNAEPLFRRAARIAVAARQPELESKCWAWLAEAQLRRAVTIEGKARRNALVGSLDLARRASAAVEHSAVYSSRQFMAELATAKAQRALGEGRTAIAGLTQAVRRIESPRAAATGTDSDRADFFVQFVNAFDLLVDWNLADGHAIESLTAAESSRNHAYLDHLRLASVDARPMLAAAGQGNLAHEQRDALAAYHQAVYRLREVADQPGSDEQIRALVDEIAGWRAKYARIETTIRDASPYRRALWGDSATLPDWSAIAPKILTPDNLLLFYYLGHAQSYLFVVSKGPPPDRGGSPRLEAVELHVPASLARRVGADAGPLTRGMAARLLELEWQTMSDPRAAEAQRGLTSSEQIALTEMLLPKSVRQAVTRARTKFAYVIPDGLVRQPPLEALLLESQPDKYVVDAFPPLSYAPSATVLALRRSSSSTAERQPASLLTLGIADYPQPSDRAATPDNPPVPGTTVGAKYRALGGPLDPLPMAPEECARVRHALETAVPGADMSLLIGAATTKTNLRSALPGRRFVHVAARGLFDQEAGNLFGAIALAADRSVVQDDGFLALNEIPGLPLDRCQLAAFSHCETRLGPAESGEPGFWLARAAMAAGAEDVVSSQWSTDDRAAAELMGMFFENVSQDLRRDEPPRFAAALQAARNAVRRDPRWAAPHYWAPWILVGPTR